MDKVSSGETNNPSGAWNETSLSVILANSLGMKSWVELDFTRGGGQIQDQLPLTGLLQVVTNPGPGGKVYFGPF